MPEKIYKVRKGKATKRNFALEISKMDRVIDKVINDRRRARRISGAVVENGELAQVLNEILAERK